MKELKPIKGIIKAGLDFAARNGASQIKPVHLFIGILEQGKNESCELLLNLGMDIDSVLNLLNEILLIHEENRLLPNIIPFTTEAQMILDNVNNERKLLDSKSVNSHHLMLSILFQKDSAISKFLRKFGVEYKTYKKELKNMSMMYSNDETFGQEDNTSKSKICLYQRQI